MRGVGSCRYLAERAARASRRGKTVRPWGCAASSAHVADTFGRLTVAALRPSKPSSRSVASRPASSESKARKTRGQPRREAAAFSTPWVPRGGAGGNAPPGNRKPVEDAFGEHRPRRSEAEPPKSKHRLGTGERLEPWGSVEVYGPPRKPPDKSPGYLWNDDHPREPLRAPLREQAGVPEPLGGEAGGLDGFAEAVPRREAEAQPQGGVQPTPLEARYPLAAELRRSRPA